jgi:CheY-like chemotaxis protein
VTSILVAEDDEELCQAMAGLFRRNGYTVYSVRSGNKAIEVLKTTPNIELVLSDYFMPDGDGRQLLEYVNTLTATRPVFILITGQADLSAKDMIQLGADHMLFKPIPIRDLLSIVAKSLGPAG